VTTPGEICPHRRQVNATLSVMAVVAAAGQARIQVSPDQMAQDA
jgi:hypothetical protein